MGAVDTAAGPRRAARRRGRRPDTSRCAAGGRRPTGGPPGEIVPPIQAPVESRRAAHRAWKPSEPESDYQLGRKIFVLLTLTGFAKSL